MEKYINIEKSIIKKYRKVIWQPFIKAIKDYKLINEGDNVAVCISGGKDSFLMANCIEEFKKHNKINFNVQYIVMDPGYSKINKKFIEDNAKTLNINLNIFKVNIFKYVTNLKEGSPCYVCARMRRGNLYKIAKDLGCNKIALGHHFDDVIETILLNVLYSAQIRTMMPKLHSTNFKDMQLIRPMYYIKEKDITAWSKYNNLDFMNCGCKFTQGIQSGKISSKRKEIKELISSLRKTSPYIEKNIFNSVNNVNLDTVIGYTKDNNYINFVDVYDNKK